MIILTILKIKEKGTKLLLILTNKNNRSNLLSPLTGLTNLQFTEILTKLTGSSSPLEGEQAPGI
jgi:hypothetical protein